MKTMEGGREAGRQGGREGRRGPEGEAERGGLVHGQWWDERGSYRPLSSRDVSRLY